MRAWRRHPWVAFGLWAANLGLALLIATTWLSHYPLCWDLTEEKRYTLSPATRTQLQQLQAPLHVEVYLEGKLPAGFRRLRQALQHMLQNMDKASPQGLQIRFIDPNQGASARTRRQYMLSLAQKGIQPTNLSYQEEDRSIERLIFPGLLLNYQGKEVGIMLLKGSRNAGAEGILNQSIEGLEYQLLKGIEQLLRPERQQIGLLRGHDNIDSLRMAKLQAALLEAGYAPQSISLKEEDPKLKQCPLLLIIKPEKPFTKPELYRIDQYLMRGGQLMLFLEGLYVAADQVSETGTLALARPTGLEDLLFHYGIRIQARLLSDLYAAQYPVITGNMGNQPQIRLLPWPFFPLVHQKSKHPITRNLEALLLRYASALDTVKAEHIQKEPLLYSSPYTQIIGAPAIVALNQLKKPPQKEQYRGGVHVLGYLLEGPFRSAFRNRPRPRSPHPFQAQGLPSRIIIVGDGDLPLGDPHPRSGQIMDIGMYLPENTQYGNLDFLLQALDYCYNPKGSILTRNRHVKLRPLDTQKIAEGKTFWQMLNLFLPLVLLALLGLGRLLLRTRLYSRP